MLETFFSGPQEAESLKGAGRAARENRWRHVWEQGIDTIPGRSDSKDVHGFRIAMRLWEGEWVELFEGAGKRWISLGGGSRHKEQQGEMGEVSGKENCSMYVLFHVTDTGGSTTRLRMQS